MNIVMFTNTYTPIAGGVARSVEAFTHEFRRRGHRVLVLAPEFPNMPTDEEDVLRIPAIQKFNGSDFSAVLPVSGLLSKTLNQFQPDVIHAHHPYLLGVTALRIARYREIPLVFTHHTRYEEYTHYVPGDSPQLRRFVVEAAVRFSNLADQVFAPSESIMTLLRERGVSSPILVVPTGVDVQCFATGDDVRLRQELNIPADNPVIGHLGRLAPEKNLDFLTDAVMTYLLENPDAHFLLVGTGTSEQSIHKKIAEKKLESRLHHLGVIDRQQLVDAYHAMTVFVFASKSETQGMVLTEAMAAGTPVVALDAPGAREVVKESVNGRLLLEQSVESFADAISWVCQQSNEQKQRLHAAALATANEFSMGQCAGKALACFESLQQRRNREPEEEAQWHHILQLIKTEWDILKGVGAATQSALSREEKT